jgi:hypothetical protein
MCHRLIPYAFINSAAVVTSFHFPLLIDDTVYQKVLDWNGVSPMVFWVGDIAIHFIPCLIGIILFHEERHGKNERKERQVRIVHGLVTATAHFSWAMLTHHTLLLNNAYIEISDLLWICTWIVAFATHIGIPILFIFNQRNKEKQNEKRCVKFDLNSSMIED